MKDILHFSSMPKLVSINDYREWVPEAQRFIQRSRYLGPYLRKELLLKSLPNSKPFRKLSSADILTALKDSWNNCLFYGPCEYVSEDKICLYSCCKHCEDLKLDLKCLVHTIETTNGCVKVLVRRKMKDVIDQHSTYRLFGVTISSTSTWPKNSQRHFDLAYDTSGSFNGNISKSLVQFGQPSNKLQDEYSSSFQQIFQCRSSQARQWFQNCKNHHNCHTLNSGFVPRRLVFVGDKHSQLCLVDTEKIETAESFKYAALSYCWGHDQKTFKTTRENINWNKYQIRSQELPKTIRDAIHVCRELGIRHLWVDALCIIQNDVHQQDWYEQSGMMRQIYSNAELTITADDAPGCDTGFLDSYSTGWQSLNVENRQDNSRSWFKSTEIHSQDILSTRGWALQERILSHRTMRFSANGIRWECDQCCKEEDGNHGLNFLGLAFRAFRLRHKVINHELLDCPEDPEGETSTHITHFLSSCSWKSIYYAWTSIVEDYSGKELTNPRDRLSAISGLASLVIGYQGMTAESYLAGLWKEDLIDGLLWWVVGPKIPSKSSVYIAPSWSWASMNGGIKYFHERYQFSFQPYIKIVSAVCTATAYDPTGRVSSGVIRLVGHLVPVDLIILPCLTFGKKYNEGILPPDFSTTDSFGSSYVHGTPGSATRIHDQIVLVQRRFTNKEMTRDGRRYEVLCDQKMELTTVWGGTPTASFSCLSIGETVDKMTGGSRHWWLVLQETKEAHTYQRVGIGYFQYLTRSFDLFDQPSISTQISII